MAGRDTDIAAAKNRLRAEVLSARAAMSEAELAAAGAALADRGLGHWHGVARVAAYLEFGTEPPTRPLLDALAAGGTEVVVPVVDGNDLDWVRYLPGGPMTRGRLGSAEPAGERLGRAALATADVVLVPALAVDLTGNRLGRGRGYYDRVLSSVAAPAVAVGYDGELVEQLPVEPHDRPVQGMLRPCGYLRL
ncbi:MAG TPA: 5-formyltetrahydrofolate cyclo-ligase [Mycobacteriales bacterium]|nr:5-formyltetrahydrofolate cyclo-ligase [Mycobacteriales bacterium]